MMRFWLTLFSIVLGAQASAVDLSAPAVLATEQLTLKSDYRVPIGIFDGQTVPTSPISGDVRIRAWHVSPNGQSLQQSLEAIGTLLEEQGYRKTLDCRDHVCGGFDFRFEINVMPAPNMYVNLRDFRFSTFLRGDQATPDQAVTVLASRIGEDAFIQITEIVPSLDGIERLDVASPRSEDTTVATDTMFEDTFSTRLKTNGSAVLEGLEFQTGATVLGEGPFAALSELAEFLLQNPELRVVLVGHTDATGSFDGNVRVSKARAEAVRQRMIQSLEVDQTRLQAEGMGYLAPRATNFTAQGREANRRVEAVVLPQSE